MSALDVIFLKKKLKSFIFFYKRYALSKAIEHHTDSNSLQNYINYISNNSSKLQGFVWLLPQPLAAPKDKPLKADLGFDYL